MTAPKPTPPTPCVCGAIHRTHIEALTPTGTHRAIAIDAVEEHELVALDGAAQICSCGARHSSHLEHLADVALGEILTAA